MEVEELGLNNSFADLKIFSALISYARVCPLALRADNNNIKVLR
jgi:hypothetical protein